ncbi:MAG: histidine kinase [Clostridia bacterium]|nr:histidine kinase [Clostridia bacterium]
MDKNKQKKRGRSQLISRIAKPYFILVAAVMSAAMVLSYFYYLNRAEVNAERSARSIAKTEATLVSDYIDDLEFIANQVNRQSRVTAYFYQLDLHPSPGNEFDGDILRSIDISSELYALIRDRADDYYICIFNQHGDFISSRTYSIDKDLLAQWLERMDFRTEIIKIEANGGRSIYAPETIQWTYGTSEYVTVRIEMKNETANSAVGIIEVHGRADGPDFESPLNDTHGSYSLEIRHRLTGDTIYTVGGVSSAENRKTVTEHIPGTEWESVIIYTSPGGINYLLRILGIFTLILAALTGFIFFVTYIIGRSVTRPIMQLADRVRSIRKPSEQINVVDDSALDEIRDLEESFEEMLDRVNKSAFQEKKAYSLALQAQMNPHFLYNCLSIIGAAGEEAGAENVTDMCVKLSDMLRYVASYEKITVPLKEETAHTSNYLSLMKSRYEDLFDYSISVDDGLLNMPVPKLLIQPLAENCFKHGFKTVEPPWSIGIELHGNEDRWELTINDNGAGMSAERISEIREKIDRSVNDMALSDMGGVGLVNNIVRLKLTHSKKTDISIEGSDGTHITIVVEPE